MNWLIRSSLAIGKIEASPITDKDEQEGSRDEKK